MASNVDQALLITTLKEPGLKRGFIDRFLLMAEPYNIPVIIALNKSDLLNEADDLELERVSNIYTKLGYEVMSLSAKENSGMDVLARALEGKISLISGQSGVGKSSIVNRLLGGKDIRVATLSQKTGKGQHTTTFAEMFDLPQGGSIIDTPGLKSLSFNNLEVEDVVHNFREIFEYSEHCKYGNCAHRNEPKCAVKEGVQNNEIDSVRYQNYLQIIREIEEQNYWELHDD